ncbi:MAG: DUF4038 domain-containing protein [Chloroflexi bacterium]|nr:DUF4038 domain-containing protein [Chloroflexota bacterium]
MSETPSRVTQVNVPVDVTIVIDAGLDAPEVDVRFGGPAGEELLVPAFQAGDRSIRVRFAAPTAGTWTWESRSTEDRLRGIGGRLEVQPYTGDNVLYQRGRLRVSDGRRHLEHIDGSPFLWIGDTWWYGLSSRLSWPSGFGTLLADRVEKGFSVIQIVAGPLPEFPASAEGIWDPGQANEAGWPWERDWARIDGAFYDRADERIRSLVEAGMVPCIVSMWGYYYTLMGAERVRRHWRNLVARYAAYPVVFCVAGEVNLPPASVHLPPLPTDDPAPMAAAREEQLIGWSETGTELRRIDPYRNPITAHPAHPNVRRVLPDPSALDIDMIQSSHWSYQIPTPSIRDFIGQVLGLETPIRLGLEGTIALAEEAVAQDPPMVVINGEPCYEGIMGTNWQDVQRLLFWTGMLSGLAGWTYGAQGIWQMNSREHPDLIRGTWGTGVWEDAMHYPGSRQVPLGGRLLEELRWWTLRPVEDARIRQQGRRSAFGAASDDAAIYYLASEFVSEEWRGVKGLAIDVPDGDGGHAAWISPRTLDEQPLGPVVADASGRWTVPATPSMEDWLLVIRRGPAASGR